MMKYFIRKYSCTFVAQAESCHQADAAIEEVQGAMEDAVREGLRTPGAEVRIFGSFDNVTRELRDVKGNENE
jgi:hypothetical protein